MHIIILISCVVFLRLNHSNKCNIPIAVDAAPVYMLSEVCIRYTDAPLHEMCMQKMLV